MDGAPVFVWSKAMYRAMLKAQEFSEHTVPDSETRDHLESRQTVDDMNGAEAERELEAFREAGL